MKTGTSSAAKKQNQLPQLANARNLLLGSRAHFSGERPVCAETLKEALTAAYLFNPTLKSARAQLRATDNQVSLAKSGYRPTISAQFQYGYEDLRSNLQNGGSGTIPVCAGAINADGTCAGACQQAFL